MKDSFFNDIQIEEDSITFEDYMRMQCQLQIDKLMQHCEEKVRIFREEAAKVRKDLEEVVGTEKTGF
jgi:hypothetical protein